MRAVRSMQRPGCSWVPRASGSKGSKDALTYLVHVRRVVRARVVRMAVGESSGSTRLLLPLRLLLLLLRLLLLLLLSGNRLCGRCRSSGRLRRLSGQARIGSRMSAIAARLGLASGGGLREPCLHLAARILGRRVGGGRLSTVPAADSLGSRPAILLALSGGLTIL